MDPRKDVEWVPANERSGVPIFVEGKVDAVIGFPPEPHELRLHEVGIINSNPNKLISQGTDRRFLNELKA
jgi:NitT/TauT family transport system substrate-binding protein